MFSSATYVDAILHHDKFTGHLLTSVIHLLNQVQNDLYSKNQERVQKDIFELSLLQEALQLKRYLISKIHSENDDSWLTA
jgi:hypothetical protein